MIELSRKKLYNKTGLHVATEIIGVEKAHFTPEYIEQLKNDSEDSQGWKKHAKKLKEHGIDIEKVKK